MLKRLARKIYNFKMPKFMLTMHRQADGQTEISCGVVGENDRWQGKSRTFRSFQEAEQVLRDERVLPMVGPDQRLDAARSNIIPAFSISPETAIKLQVLHRVDPNQQAVRTFVRFHDTGGGYPNATEEYWLKNELSVGDELSVRTPVGTRTVRIDAIRHSEEKQFGSDETRREVEVEVRF